MPTRGDAVLTADVLSAAPFTVEARRYRFLDIEVESAHPVVGVFMAPSVTELKSA